MFDCGQIDIMNELSLAYSNVVIALVELLQYLQKNFTCLATHYTIHASVNYSCNQTSLF